MNRHALPGLLALILLAGLPVAVLAGPSSAAHRAAVEEERARAADGSPEAAEAPADAPEEAEDAGPDEDEPEEEEEEASDEEE
jgi:hypothetical protein